MERLVKPHERAAVARSRRTPRPAGPGYPAGDGTGVEVERPQQREDERPRRRIVACYPAGLGRTVGCAGSVPRRSRRSQPTANLVFAGQSHACLQFAGRCPRLASRRLVRRAAAKTERGAFLPRRRPGASRTISCSPAEARRRSKGTGIVRPPSPRAGSRRGGGRWPPRPPRAPTSSRRGGGSAGRGRPG